MSTRNRILHIVVSVLLLLFVVSCNKENNIIDTGPEPIQSFYTNDLWNVDRMEILRSDGMRKSSDNLDFIVNWLNQVGKLEVISNPSPEDYSGVAYTIRLFQGDEKLFIFTPTNINGHWIVNSKSDNFFKGFLAILNRRHIV